MNFLDKIALNRLVSIIANFILNIMKLFKIKAIDNIEIDIKPDRRRIFPIFRKKGQKNETK